MAETSDANAKQPKERSFAATFVAPALLLSLFPAFGFWFAGHATRVYDDEVYDSVRGGIENDLSLTPEQRALQLEGWRHLSVACANGLADQPGVPTELAEGCGDYAQFRMARLGSGAILGLGLLALLVIGGSAGMAYANPGMLYPAFLAGWLTLRPLSAIIVTLQGVLLVWLSFWTTALWFEVYYVKLIGAAAILALIAVAAVILAIFTKVGGPLALEGELLPEADAPELWSKVRDLCARVDTTPPDQIVLGIDTNFFVTQAELLVGPDAHRGAGTPLSGRTLFVSLSLLKVLDEDEARAVLCHEMAHFRGDTEVSNKLAPLLDRFGHYLRALREQFIAIPVYYLMLLYRASMELAIAKHSRTREFAADAYAAQIVSPAGIAHALVRIGAYARFRDRIERELFEQDAEHAEVQIGARLASGFVAYGSSPEIGDDLKLAFQPHPFDSHPPTDERLAAVGRVLGEAEKCALVASSPARTLFAAITRAEEREQALWARYEERFAEAHARDLAYRYLPATPEETELVLRFFPTQTFAHHDGEIELDHRGLNAPEFGRLEFEDITHSEYRHKNEKPHQLRLTPSVGPERVIDLQKVGLAKSFLGTFEQYFVRHKVSREEAKRRAERPATQ